MTIIRHNIILIGFGTVARGLCQILRDKAAHPNRSQVCEFKIVAVCTGSRGNMYDPQGLDLDMLVKLSSTREPFTEFLASSDTLELIRETNAHIMVELSPTNLLDAEPASSYCQAALESGKHVICGNKGPAALNYSELRSLADDQGLMFLNEATVMSGTPVFSFVNATLAGNQISQIKGILNGSTNYILTEMEAGKRRDAVLEKARQLGYLEADPKGDLDGHDAQAKIVILCNALLNKPTRLDDVKRTGIAAIDETMVQEAFAAGERWKLIASVSIQGDQVEAEVKPERLAMDHPLAQVSGTLNALTFSTDLLGDVTISGPGAGSIETAYAILSDLLIINAG